MAIVLSPDEKDITRIVAAIRELAEGRQNSVGELTLEPGVALTTVRWDNCSQDSRIFLAPLTPNAAAAVPTTYYTLADIQQKSFTIRHANNAQVDRTFAFVCIGG